MTEAGTDDVRARRSAALVGGVLLALAAWNLYRHREAWAWTLGASGAALALVAMLSARASRTFFSLWMRLASLLGYVNSKVLLALLFYGVIAPYGFVTRALRRDPLLRRGPGKQSYWEPRTQTRQTRRGFERMF